MVTEPLNDDDPEATLTLPDGTVVRNLSVEGYEATYTEGTPCHDPDEIERALREAGVE